MPANFLGESSEGHVLHEEVEPQGVVFLCSVTTFVGNYVGRKQRRQNPLFPLQLF